MGYIVEYDDKSIWSPSRLVGELFLSQLRHLESTVGACAGVDEYMSDTIALKPKDANVFLERLIAWANLDNASMRLLLRGTVVHLLALISCAESEFTKTVSSFPAEWLQEAAELASKAMTKLA